MKFFHKKQQETHRYNKDLMEPVIRCSICNGEQVACFRNIKTGELQEIALIRNSSDLADFMREYGLTEQEIQKIY